MCPTAIDDVKFAKQDTLDMSKPQGTTQGLPVKQIPHQEYPRVVYKHPNAPFYVEEHRNANHEVVHREVKSAEHRSHVCRDKAEHEEKLADGWKNDPYIQLAPPDPMDELYADVIAEDVARKSGKGKGQGPKEGKPAAVPDLDLASAQRFLQSRGYECVKPDDASSFFKRLTTAEQAAFVKELGEFLAAEGAGK